MKEYKSLDELCIYLRDHKNIVDIYSKRTLIEKRNYVSTINPFKKIFATGEDKYGNHIYNNQIEIENYAKLVFIDDMFSIKYSRLIGNLERKLKIVLTNKLCKRMKDVGDLFCVEYVKMFYDLNEKNTLNREINKMPYGLQKLNEVYSKNGIRTDENKVEMRLNLLLKLADTGTSRVKSKNSLVRHYQKNYAVVPFWLLAHILTFGELLIIYEFLSEADRLEIAKDLKSKEQLNNRDVLVFQNLLDKIRVLRNTINHYEPVFPYFCELQNKQNVYDFLLEFEDNPELSINLIFDYDRFENTYNKKIISNLKEYVKYQNI